MNARGATPGAGVLHLLFEPWVLALARIRSGLGGDEKRGMCESDLYEEARQSNA